MRPTNWSGHIIGHPLVGRLFHLRGHEASAYTVGKVVAVRDEAGRLMLHFEHWLRWVPLSECEPWGKAGAT